MTAQAQAGGNGLRLVSSRGGRSQHAGAYTVYLHLRLQIQINRELMIQVWTTRKVQFGIVHSESAGRQHNSHGALGLTKKNI